MDHLIKLYQVADEFTIDKKIVNVCAKKRLWAIIILVILEFLMLGLLIFFHELIWLLGAILCFVSALSMVSWLAKSCRCYVRNHYSRYISNHEKLGIIFLRFSFYKHVISHEVEVYLRSQSFHNNPNRIDELIQIAEIDVEENKLQRWLPFTLLGLLLLPVWGEFCGFMYSTIKGDSEVAFNLALKFVSNQIVIALLLTIVVVFWYRLFDDIFLSQVHRRKRLIKILRILKIKFS